ncbi:hypothetical protein ACIBI4_11580 [Streptomyces sp. NPDC050418]|uniref:hypothetical protein n=1 Tax=Streptomyces sp. NPDC050418 TaxID=3365612 RepID=UPI0037AFB26D
MHGGGEHRGPGRYTLTDSENGHVWGVCTEVEGLFRDPVRGTYELLDWVPVRNEVPGWIGSSVWLVPTEGMHDPWLLTDVESLGQHNGSGSLVLSGLDDHLGPPEGYRGRVRVHDEQQWLGSCREFARVLPPRNDEPHLVLREVAPSDRLRRVLATGTRRALDLDEAWLEIRDDQGEPFADRLLRPQVRAWRPSPGGSDLIDLELGGHAASVPEYARPVWERRLAGPPDAVGTWADLGTRQRLAWLELVRGHRSRSNRRARQAGHVYELDGHHITDVPGLYLALGEAVNGPGGYFGGCPSAVEDCLAGGFGFTAPATLLWRDAATARRHLSRVLESDGEEYDLVDLLLAILAEGGLTVTFT